MTLDDMPKGPAAGGTEGTPLVSVYCMTYNQRDTIGQAIDSIVSQQTDFPFELIVHDDASTDGTTEIVRQYAQRYPEIVRPVFQAENQYRHYNLIKEFIHPVSLGKYIAICEGDDFWTDPHKLQLQAEYMQSHPECTLCFHAVQQLGPDGDRMTCRPVKQTGTVPASMIIRRGGMFCATVSSMFRRDVMDYWPEFRTAADVYDYPSQALAASMGTVYYIDRVMGVYRFASAGSWTEQHAGTVDYEHLENETRWLELFDDYTGGRYRRDVDYHMAHLWLTEYRKSLDKAVRDRGRQCLRRLSGRDRFVFSALFLLFSVCGRPANRLFQAVKKQMLK